MCSGFKNRIWLLISALIFSILTQTACGGYSEGSWDWPADLLGGNTWVGVWIDITGSPPGATVTGIDVHFEVSPDSGLLYVRLGDENSQPGGAYHLMEGADTGGDHVSETYIAITRFNGRPVDQRWILWVAEYYAFEIGRVDSWWIKVYYDDGSATYCNANGGCDEYISRVEVGSIDNNSGCDGYADYTAISTEMAIGQNYDITVTNGNPYQGQDLCGIWIDWNQDKDFDDPDETITVTGNPSDGPYTAAITPPADANLGETRMRVRIVFEQTPTPCGNIAYGEVEDYTIDVVSGGYCSASGGCGDYIRDVKVGAINNTGTGCDGYADYTSLSTTMGIENSYLITVLKGGSFSWEEQCSIWVDWNQDEDFDDPGEEIIGYPAFTSFSAVITPPADAELGDTRMRIRIIEGAPEPCGQAGNGEVEDYTITVVTTIPEYCLAVGGTAICGSITRFQLKTINNSTSGCEGYADYTSISTALEIGTGYPVFVVTDGGDCRIWVDWNQDLDFDDADEQIDLTGFTYDSVPYGNTTIFMNNKIGVITPPEGAALGATRLRLRQRLFGDLSSCGVTDNGEVEDYTVIITQRGQSGEESYGGGEGTEQEPFLIYTAEQMQAIGKNNYHWAGYFKLMADIDMSDLGEDLYNIIGNEIFAFEGVFDGNCHAISNFTYQSDNKHRVGLFGRMAGNSLIKNLGLIAPDVDSSGGSAIGGLVGILESGAVSNCYVKGGRISGNEAIGAIAGGYHDTIEQCYAATSVSGNSFFGAIAGLRSGSATYDSFWDVNEALPATASAVGTAKTTIEMQAQSTFTDANWDFNGIWEICEGTNYPKLARQIPLPGDFVCPDGVDFVDSAMLGLAWGSKQGDVNWNPDCDISETKDNVIDMRDLAALSDEWLLGR